MKSLEASKWLDLQFLISPQELRSLFEEAAPFQIFKTGAVLNTDQGEIDQAAFLETYTEYYHLLKEKNAGPLARFRAEFSCVLLRNPEALFSVEIPQGKKILRIGQPVVQVQAHTMHFSPIDNRFRPMVFGTDSISWGLQLSYPQMCLDPETRQILPVNDTPQFPNTSLFKLIQRWMRKNTIPTPFLVADKVINVPVRIGKECLAWINGHPDLKQKDLKVKVD